MKIRTLTLIAAAALMFNACNKNNPASVNQVSATDSLFTANQAGFQFELMLPKSLLADFPAELFYDEVTGHYRVRAGSGFQFEVSDEKNSIEELKAQLADEMLYKNQIEQEDAESILYQRILPDGQQSYYQFVRTFSAQGKNYVARTAADGQFNREQAELMATAIRSIR